MSRRHRAEKRQVVPDARYKSPLVAHLVNVIMKSGKKNIAQRIVYGAFEKWGSTTAQGTDWAQVFTNAKDDLSQRAALDGIESLEGSYKQVSAAAKECGMEVRAGLGNLNRTISGVSA